MEAFETKKALLEYLGKNPKDNKLVDRMMLRGEVYLEGGMFYLADGGDVNTLRERVAELEKKLKEAEIVPPIDLPQYAEELKSVEVKMSENRIKELESDVEYLNKEYEKMGAKIKKYQAAIRNSFYYINDTLHKKIDWPTYKATIKLEWDLPWEDNQ